MPRGGQRAHAATMTTTVAGTLDSTTSARRLLSFGAIGGLAVFCGGWILAEGLEGHGYSIARHDISDLGALTAHYAPLIRVTDAIGGLLVMAFALFALAPALAAPGRRVALGAVTLAASLPSFDTATDALFRLDCRAADHGCSVAQATTSWHGKAHIIAFAVSALASIATPFLLARRMRMLDAWRDLARPTRIFGIVFIVLLAATIPMTDTSIGGWAQRAVILYTCVGVAALAMRTART